MTARDNTSAARTCLVVLGIGALFMLVACGVLLLAVGPLDILDEPATQPPDRSGTVEAADPFTVAVMDVGQGQSVVIITPDARSMLIDGGRSGDRMEEAIIPYLQEHGIEELDYLVISHPDQDHIGGFPRLLENMPVRALVDPVIPNTNQTYAQILETALELGIEGILVRRGDTLDLGADVEVDVLWPTDEYIAQSGDDERNDNSIVLKLQYGDVSILIPGDAERGAETELVEHDESDQLQSDILVVGHHGSNTSSTAEFLDAVDPTVAIISAGLDNQYGHPHDEVLQRLRFRGITVYRTDLEGTIEIVSDGESFQVIPLGTDAMP
jgi:competence protein ComEC